MKKIKTGIIGGSIRNRWASSTHIPALLHSELHEITAIATTNMASAQEAADRIGNVSAYDDYTKMLESSDVDMVIVSVKAPYHHEIILNAIHANKHIYCEWPLAVTASEVDEIMVQINGSQVRHAIGLQSRQADEVRRVKEMIDHQEIGRILSVNMKSSTQAKGNWADSGSSYILERSNGATLLTINGGHALDIVSYLLGHFSEVQASHHTHYNEAHITDQGRTINKNIEDQYIIQGKINLEIPVSIHLQGGAYPQFILEVQGELGIIRLYQNRSIGHPQYGGLSVSLVKYDSSQAIASSQHDDFTLVMEDMKEFPLTNVARAHQSFAEDILSNSDNPKTPDFHYAAYLHQLIRAIEESARTGRRMYLN
ncbi:Gfo/Idh/MocA family oxidoreductase [Paenibacillus motobuensis]|uniref:Gfo/Idh/MocA family protein n=1 Tax=Paenibacillus TaxID=44249 RepID=UPI00203F159C|nr:MULTISPECIES: Gfo/Idh/MocA family oxidoreductase [Paenibacillus]MCM3041575.1 Gfo/Idh/MocA family oxidoreductase [Paenibacillus lutimineralis]MCM3648679.1 Gfo/Idh/MocA family oxidoreductase [Paenibacillus motobuensis]